MGARESRPGQQEEHNEEGTQDYYELLGVPEDATADDIKVILTPAVS
jgi:hypothetical protein